MCDLPGLIIYALLILLLSFSIIVRNHRYALLVVMSIAVVIASLRGTAGVDTYLYIARFEHVNESLRVSLIEPIIPFLMWFTKSIGGTFELFSLIYGGLLVALYYHVFKKFPNALYFGLAIFPVIFIDSLFNGVRVGLAYPLVILSVIYSSSAILLTAASSHVSSMMAAAAKIVPVKYLIASLILLIVVVYIQNITVLDLLSARYASKFDAYQSLSTPNPYGGIADTSALFVALFIYFRVLGYRGYNFVIKIFVTLLILVLYQVFFVTEYTFLLRVTRMIIIIIFALIAKQRSGIDKTALYFSFIFGILYSANFVRQIISTCSYDEGGFLPINLGIY